MGKKSSYCDTSACVDAAISEHRQMKISTKCETGACVQVGVNPFKIASDCEGGACVEVSGLPDTEPDNPNDVRWWRTEDGGFQIRQGIDTLTYDASELEAFVKGVRAGEFTRGMLVMYALRQGFKL